MSGYPCKWFANSTKAGDKSGTGQFTVEGITYMFSLNDFDDFERIGRALEAAFMSGLQSGKNRGLAAMQRAMENIGATP